MCNNLPAAGARFSADCGGTVGFKFDALLTGIAIPGKPVACEFGG